MSHWDYDSEDTYNQPYNAPACDPSYRHIGGAGLGIGAIGGSGWGLLIGGAIVIGVFAAIVGAIRSFLAMSHDQPYEAVAMFYRAILGAAGGLASWYTHLAPTPYPNLNFVILLTVAIGVAFGCHYGLRVVAERIDTEPKKILKMVSLVFAAPGLFGASWWLVVHLVEWLFAAKA